MVTGRSPAVIQGVSAPATATAASCKILVRESTISGGSGTCIYVDPNDRTAVILTCRHVCPRADQQIIVTFTNGRQHAATWIGVDTTADLAALLIQGDAATPWVPLSITPPVGGATVFQIGFPGGGPIRHRMGNLRGYDLVDSSGSRQMTFSFSIQGGDSGSGVFTADSHLVGVMWGSVRGGGAVATGLHDVTRFVQKTCWWVKKKPNQPRAQQLPSAPSAPGGTPGPTAPSAPGGTPGPTGPVGPAGPQGAPGRDADHNLLGKMRDRIDSHEKKIDSVKNLVGDLRQIKTAAAPAAAWLPWLIGGSAVGALSPLVMAGLWGITTLRRRRLPGASVMIPTPAPLQNVPATPSALPTHEVKFVEVEKPSNELQRLLTAMEVAGRDYPGSLATINLIQGLAKQLQPVKT